LLSEHYNYNDLLKNPSFRRWVKSTATEEERRFWDEWTMKSPANRTVAIKAMKEITGFAIHSGEEISTDEAWNELLRQIESGQHSKRYKTSVRTNKRIRVNSLQWVVRVAALLLLGFITFYITTQLYQTPPENAEVSQFTETELTTDYGEQKSIRFSDGSEITLNGNSRLLTSKYSGDSASINLYLEGEAYFSITPRENSEDNPFRIETANGLVKVLGTQLVVFTRNNQTKVFLENGSVAVNPLHLETETILSPGQHVSFDDTVQSLEVHYVNPEIYTSWLNGRLYFEQATVEEVLVRIEDTFGIKAVVRDSTVFEHKISGSIESSELEIITSALSEILNVTIEKSETENVIYIGSTLE